MSEEQCVSLPQNGVCGILIIAVIKSYRPVCKCETVDAFFLKITIEPISDSPLF